MFSGTFLFCSGLSICFIILMIFYFLIQKIRHQFSGSLLRRTKFFHQFFCSFLICLLKIFGKIFHCIFIVLSRKLPQIFMQLV